MRITYQLRPFPNLKFIRIISNYAGAFRRLSLEGSVINPLSQAFETPS